MFGGSLQFNDIFCHNTANGDVEGENFAGCLCLRGENRPVFLPLLFLHAHGVPLWVLGFGFFWWVGHDRVPLLCSHARSSVVGFGVPVAARGMITFP